MPKKKGGKGVRRGKNKGFSEQAREIEFCKEDQAYGKVKAKLGNSRFTIQVVTRNLEEDGGFNIRDVIGHAPRGLKRSSGYIDVNDIVLVTKREYQEDKCDIIHKYYLDEVRRLVNYEEIPSSFTDNNTITDGDNFVFDDAKEDEEAEMNLDDL